VTPPEPGLDVREMGFAVPRRGHPRAGDLRRAGFYGEASRLLPICEEVPVVVPKGETCCGEDQTNGFCYAETVPDVKCAVDPVYEAARFCWWVRGSACSASRWRAGGGGRSGGLSSERLTCALVPAPRCAKPLDHDRRERDHGAALGPTNTASIASRQSSACSSTRPG
jgi:hypothetical protein